MTKLQPQILPELQRQNLDKTLCSKSEQKFNFITKPQQSATNCCQYDPHHLHQQQYQPQQVLSWHLHTPGSHQSSLLNGSQLVSQ